MKKMMIVLAVVLMACNTNSKKMAEGYQIHGELTNVKDSTLLILDNLSIGASVDSTYVIGGKFDLTGVVDEASRFVLKTKFNPSAPKSFKYLFFWIDNTPMTIEGDFNDFRYARVKGSQVHKLDYELTQKQKNYFERRSEIVDSVRSEKAVTNREALLTEMRAIDSTTNVIVMDFIKKQPNNLVALEQLSFKYDQFTKEELSKIYDSLDDNLKQTANGKVLKNYIELDKVLEKGDAFAQIKGKTLTGEEVSLLDIVDNNKLTILDFWAAGCGPCRMQSKQYVELYEKYKPKGLEIVSYSLDKNRKYWEKASEEDNISWVNISNLEGNNSKEAMVYGVKGIPNCFLIDQEGNIVAELNGYNKDEMPFFEELEKL